MLPHVFHGGLSRGEAWGVVGVVQACPRLRTLRAAAECDRMRMVHADGSGVGGGQRDERTRVDALEVVSSRTRIDELINNALSNPSLPGWTSRTLRTALDELLQPLDQILNTFQRTRLVISHPNLLKTLTAPWGS